MSPPRISRPALAILLATASCRRGHVAATVDAYSHGVASRVAAMAAWLDPDPAADADDPGPDVTVRTTPPGGGGSGEEELRRLVAGAGRALTGARSRAVEVLSLSPSARAPRATLRFHMDGERGARPASLRLDVEVDMAVDGESIAVDRFRVLGATLVTGGERRFHDRAAELGLSEPHRLASASYRRAAVPGFHASPGCAVADLDGDGWPDVVVADGGRDHVYLNRGGARFEESAEALGIRDGGDGRGVLAFDREGDGDVDLLVVNADRRPDVYVNAGRGILEERGSDLGIDGVVQGTSAAAADVDGDGLLDVFIACYGDAPRVWPSLPGRNGEPDRLFVRRGERYAEMGRAAGVADEGWGLAAAFADYDGDGDQDLYVANDFGRNALLQNRSRGGEPAFHDVSNRTGTTDRGFGMSVAWGDHDGDLDLDLYVGNYYWEGRYVFRHPDFPLPPFPAPLLRPLIRRQLGHMTRGNSLFVNRGQDFSWESDASAVANGGWAWGSGFLDWDLDGDLDILSTNGWISGPDARDRAVEFWTHMVSDYEAMQSGRGFVDIGDASLHGRERERLFVNTGGDGKAGPRFVEAAFAAGLDTVRDGRGLAFGDLDRDGDLDAVVGNHLQPPSVLMNEAPPAWSFVEIELDGPASGIGSLVTARAGGRAQVRHLGAGDTFLSSSEPMVHFGLARGAPEVDVEVRWPDGVRTSHPRLAAGRRHRLTRPTRRPPANAPS